MPYNSPSQSQYDITTIPDADLLAALKQRPSVSTLSDDELLKQLRSPSRKPVTDPQLLAQLNAPGTGRQPVTDPDLLAQLNAPDAPVTASGVAKQAALGLPRGVISLAGIPNLVEHGLYALSDKVGNTTPEMLAKRAQGDIFPSSDEIQKKLEGYTGSLPEPQNNAERLASAATEMLPASLGGPESLAAKLLGGAAAGVASEGAGQLAEGTPVEPYARVAGALLAPSAVSKVLPKAASGLATADELVKAGGKGYDAIRADNLAVKPSEMRSWANQQADNLNADNFVASRAPLTHAVLDDLKPISNTDVTAKDLDLTRLRLRDIVGKGGPDGEAARRAMQDLNTKVGNAQFAAPSVVAGNPTALAKTWSDANANYSAGKVAGTVDDLIRNAQTRAEVANSGKNSGNTIRQAISRLETNPKLARGLTDAEQAQVSDIIRQSFAVNKLRSVANKLGGGGGMGQLWTALGITGAAEASGAGHEGSAATGLGSAVLGALARRSYNNAVLRNASRLSEKITARAPLNANVQAAVKEAPGLKLLQALALARIASNSNKSSVN